MGFIVSDTDMIGKSIWKDGLDSFKNLFPWILMSLIIYGSNSTDTTRPPTKAYDQRHIKSNKMCDVIFVGFLSNLAWMMTLASRLHGGANLAMAQTLNLQGEKVYSCWWPGYMCDMLVNIQTRHVQGNRPVNDSMSSFIYSNSTALVWCSVSKLLTFFDTRTHHLYF